MQRPPSDENAGADPGRPPMPLWVKGFIVVGLVALLVIIVILLLGGNHGPGRHAP